MAPSTTTSWPRPRALTGGDSPLGGEWQIALAGIAAVARHVVAGAFDRGPVAGIVAGLLMAVSASAIEESTFIWNPNLIALSSAIALGGCVAGMVDAKRPAGGSWRRSGPR